MRRRSTLAAALLALTCIGLIAGVASAARSREAEEVRPPAGFELQGTNGYTIAVSAYLEEATGRGRIALTASREHETVSYLVPAKVTDDAIRADLGRLGRVDLVLHKTGGTETVKEKCSRYRETFEAGTYEGRFEFNGEGGFTRARATQVTAAPYVGLLDFSFGCENKSSGESFSSRLPGARLAGTSYADGRVLKFKLNKNRPTGKTVYSASLKERRDGIKIYRELSGVAPAGAFHYAPSLRTATVSPPAPFSGSASLGRSRNAIAAHLTGTLKLAFPGHTVGLTGPEVHVSIVHARQTTGEDGNITIGLPRVAGN